MRSNKRTPSNRALPRRSPGIYPVGIHVFIKKVVFCMHLLLNQSMKDSCISKMTTYYQIFEGSGQYFKICTHVCIYTYSIYLCTSNHLPHPSTSFRGQGQGHYTYKRQTQYLSVLDVFSHTNLFLGMLIFKTLKPSKTQYHWRVATQWMILKFLKITIAVQPKVSK